jgi:hypothetical protein
MEIDAFESSKQTGGSRAGDVFRCRTKCVALYLLSRMYLHGSEFTAGVATGGMAGSMVDANEILLAELAEAIEYNHGSSRTKAFGVKRVARKSVIQ